MIEGAYFLIKLIDSAMEDGNLLKPSINELGMLDHENSHNTNHIIRTRPACN